ncbi:MAG: RidA family protein [Rhodothermaceae bacterium]
MLEQKIKELCGFELPEAPKPLAAYIPVIKDGNTVYTAGQLPVLDGKIQCTGKLGKDVSIEDGKKAAKLCAVNCLSVIKSVAGSLENIDQIIKVTVFVASAEGFTDQPQVANGASEFVKEVFGEKGAHVRSAVGVSELPAGVPVEIEMIARLK